MTADGDASPLLAQASSAIDQSRLFNNTGGTSRANVGMTPDGDILPNDEGSNSGDDSFGKQQVLKNQEPVQPWVVAGDTSIFFTSNAALTRSHTISDVFGVLDASLSRVSPLSRDLLLQIGVRTSIFRYDDTSALDFENLGAGLGLVWAPGWARGITFFGRYDFSELLDKHSREILSDHEWTVGAQKTFVPSRTQAFSLGMIATAGVSDPFSAQRDQIGGFAGYHVQIARNLEADLFYRLGYYFYNEADRRDLNHVLSATIAYHPSRWTSLVGFLSLGENSSNRSVFDYEVFSGGGGIGFNVKF